MPDSVLMPAPVNTTIRRLSAIMLVVATTRTGRPAIVTRHGRPVTALVGLDPDELEDYVLAHAPEFVRATRAADADLRAGRARAADEVFAELEQD